ncbi:MAG: hypothetical protein HY720_17400 [Planctomycetes bacterium]|nr:hypothetical protein [Planctomycetota bacterium]
MRGARNFSDWYERVYPDLHHHGLWLRGGEINTLPPEELARRDFRVLFARLSTYYDTGYSFTHQILYQIASRVPGVYPDLAYLPPRSDEAIFAAGGIPWLIGTQSKLGPDGFDLVGFSNSIVQELANLPTVLAASGIPLSKRERLRRPDAPLLVLGGANALYTSALWSDDPLVDGIFVGESDAAIRRLLEICRDGKRTGLEKGAILERLQEIGGFLEPDRPRRTSKALVWDLNACEPIERAPVPYIEDELGSSHLQISEGCPCFCSFCAESWDRKPYRERTPEVLARQALAAKSAMGLDSIDLYSFNFNMHSGFYRVLWDLVPLFRGIGLKSQRFDLLAHDPQMVEFQHAIEKASITCGLEGVSPRMRRYLHKNLEDGDLHASLEAIFRSNARQLKVFLIATGLEEEQDLVAFEDLLEHLAEIRGAARSGTRVIFSIMPLVRFPWTPLEFEDAPPALALEPILSGVARRVRRAGFEFREAAQLPDYWVSQILVRAADPRVGRALVDAVRETGFVYRGEIPESFRAAFENALSRAGLLPAALLAGHTLGERAEKPWAAIDTRVKSEFLWAEVERARAYKEMDYCLGRSWTRAKCFHCGGCPSKEHVRDIVLARQGRDYGLPEFRERVRAARESQVSVRLLVEVGEKGHGVPRKMVGVSLARAIMLAEPELAESYRGYAGSRWDDGSRRPVWIVGQDAITLLWRRQGLPALEAMLGDPARVVRVDAELSGWARVLGLAPEDWELGEIAIDSPFPWKGDPYLVSLRLSHTKRRTLERVRDPATAEPARPRTWSACATPDMEGAYRYDLAPAAIRRGILRTLTVESRGAGSRITLAPGPKFEVAGFLQNAFALPGRHDWVRIRAVASGRTIPTRPEPSVR